MKTTQFKGEGDNLAVRKEENYFPFQETGIALSLKEVNWNAKVLFYFIQPIFTSKRKNELSSLKEKNAHIFVLIYYFKLIGLDYKYNPSAFKNLFSRTFA